MLFPPAQSSIWRYGAKPRKRTRSLKFVRQKEQRRGNVSDWYHASKHWLFATFASLFSSLRASSSSLPSFASRRRLLGLRRRSFRTRGCRSGVDLDDLGAKKDYEEMLAKKWRLCTDEDALVLRLNVQANFPEQRRAQAVPLSGHIAMRSLPDASISGLLRKRATANPFTRVSCSSWSSNGHTSTTVWQKNQKRTTFFSTTSDRQRARVKRKNVCKSKAWRDGANLKAHIASRSFPREIPVRGRFFSNAVFNHFPLEDFSQTNGNRLVGAPRAHFRQKLKIDK